MYQATRDTVFNSSCPAGTRCKLHKEETPASLLEWVTKGVYKMWCLCTHTQTRMHKLELFLSWFQDKWKSTVWSHRLPKRYRICPCQSKELLTTSTSPSAWHAGGFLQLARCTIQCFKSSYYALFCSQSEEESCPIPGKFSLGHSTCVNNSHCVL